MARRKKRGEAEHENHERWLVTYADLITLLMVFFIVMYSMSQVDLAKFAAISDSLTAVLSGSQSIADGGGPSLIDGSVQVTFPSEGEVSAQEQIKELRDRITEFLEEQEGESPSGVQGQQVVTRVGENIVVMEQERGLVISFKDSLLFASGSAVLTPLAQEIITSVGNSLIGIRNYIRIEGHTDNLPINTARYPSNWELSSARAANVLHLLQDRVGLPPDRLSIVGYGEHRPLVVNADDASRAMNRRVDIVILKIQYDYFEPINVPAPVPVESVPVAEERTGV
jgi:chemotaxis protein MotB